MIKIFLTLIFSVSFYINSDSQILDWRLLSGSPGTNGASRFEDMSFINSSTGWLVGYTGKVYRTTNGGVKWDTVFTSPDGFELRSVGFFDSNVGMFGTLFDDTNKILYRTTNAGFNWTAVSNISGKRPQGICGMYVASPNIAYAVGRYYSSARIIKTTDKGVSWNVVFNDTSLARTLIDCYFWSPDSGLAVGGYNTSSFENGNAIILRTTNGGASWQRVVKTVRTGEWCWKISFISRDIGYVSIEREGGFAYILKTTNNGLNWAEIPFRDYDEEGIGFVNENTGWLGGWTGPTYKTTNGGINWQLAGWGININRFRFMSDTLAYAVGDRVYKYSRGPVGIQPATNEIPTEFNLSQNYPNPFNPGTVIRYSLIENSFVTLKIFDALGKEIATPVNDQLSAGTYEVNFDGSSLPSGIYFYKLQTRNYSLTKRMVLLK